MNSPSTILLRSIGVVRLTLVAYGVVVSATRMALLSYAITAAKAGVGLACAIFGD